MIATGNAAMAVAPPGSYPVENVIVTTVGSGHITLSSPGIDSKNLLRDISNMPLEVVKHNFQEPYSDFLKKGHSSTTIEVCYKGPYTVYKLPTYIDDRVLGDSQLVRVSFSLL